MASHQKPLRTLGVAMLTGMLLTFSTPPVTAGPKSDGVSPQPPPYTAATAQKAAKEIFSKLTRSGADYVADVSRAIDPAGNLRIQAGLLREDLIWQNRGLTERQLDVIVLVAVALNAEQADKEVDGLQNLSRRDQKMTTRLETLVMYREQALDLVAALLNRLGEVHGYELTFRF